MMPLATNLAARVETPTMGDAPYLIDRNGHPYVPVATAGVVLGVCLGDGVFAYDADHAAPGVTLDHPDQAARHALTSYACLGNRVVVRSGAAAGATGAVLGKRGEAGHVIAVFDQATLAELVPGDQMLVRGHGQGATLGDIAMMNIDPATLPYLPIGPAGSRTEVGVRARVPSEIVGNGIGRPAQQWDLDLQVTRTDLPNLLLGDLVCVDDLDVRHNAGYRRGWCVVGVVVHGASPQPGHGPGVMPLLCGPARLFDVRVRPDDHVGVTAAGLGITDG
jgi:hypothetical protein